MSGSSAEAGGTGGPARSAFAILGLAALLLTLQGAFGQGAFGQGGPGEPLRLLPVEPLPSVERAPLPPSVEVVPLDEPPAIAGANPWEGADRDRSATLVERLTGTHASGGMRVLAEGAMARPPIGTEARTWDRLDRARIRALALYGIADPLVRILLDARLPPDERSDSLLLADALFAVDRIDHACALVRERSRRWVDADWLARLALCRFLAERRDEAIEALRALDGFGGGEPELRAALAGLESRRAPFGLAAVPSRDPATGALRAALGALGAPGAGAIDGGLPRVATPIDGAVLGLLDQAAHDGRAGDAAAIALRVLESAGPAATPRSQLDRVIAGLRASGWRSEAEAIARDAATGTTAR